MFSVLVSVLVCVCLQTVTAQPIPGAMPFRPLGPGGPLPPPFPPAGAAPSPFMTGNVVHGTCYFNDTYSPIKGRVDIRQDLSAASPVLDVRVQVTGLPQTLMSDTEHGLHVHRWGDLSRSCYNTGPHFDADEFSFHGGPNSFGRMNRHDGDWSNVRQTNNGVIDTEFKVQNMMLVGDSGILGRSIVMHEGRDDLGRGNDPTSLQTGNSGPPIACCAIGLADPTNWNNPLLVNGKPVNLTPTLFNGGLNMNGGLSNQNFLG